MLNQNENHTAVMSKVSALGAFLVLLTLLDVVILSSDSSIITVYLLSSATSSACPY